MMQTLVRGVAFAPRDDQMAAFLASRQAPAFQRPDWLVAATPPTLQVPASKRLGETAGGQTAQIRTLHAAGKSLNAIQAEVFGYRGRAA